MFLKNPKIKLFQTYMALIKNSVGSKTFQNFYLEQDGEVSDAVGDGLRSCAFFVSNLLRMLPSLIEGSHLTVDSTVKDLKSCGWEEIKEPRIGAILVWELKKIDEGEYKTRHIGFYIGANRAISNDSELRTPQKHHWTFGEDGGLPACPARGQRKPTRKVEMILWNKVLEN